MNQGQETEGLDLRQLRLHFKLAEKDQGLARLYLGGVRVRSERQLPYRFALAAHGIRELMEKAWIVAQGDRYVLCMEEERHAFTP